MSLLILDRLAGAHEALIRAFDGNDLAAIEAATTALAAAVSGAGALDSLQGDNGARERLHSLAALAVAAQQRVNFLTDRMRGRVAALASLGGQAETFTYRPGAR
ncbi:hypothetical protein [Sphingosinicella sp.]|uniref:hypothetical protein n=1 Tax=Sphingosinicella sp. TaxID=1917971 RepID=UPI0040383814